MSTLIGQVALVTGASRGIGAAVAERLAADGADVAITYRSSEERAAAVVQRIRAGGRRGLAIQADSADPAAAQTAVQRTVTSLGRLDVLVSNAGVFEAGELSELTLAQVDHTLAVHVRAPFLAAQAAAPRMADGGRIITIGSNLGARPGRAGLSLYAMSKTAVDGLTRGLAQELGGRGITANTVHPGPTDTDMNPAGGPQAQALRAEIPLGHYGQPSDVAASVAHLAGEGGRFISGSALTVDGGRNA